MAEIKDQIGRIGNFQDAAIEKLSSMLNSAVGKAVKYASEQARSSVSEKDYEKLAKALEDLGDDIKESLKATKKFVEDVKGAAKSFDQAKQSRRTSTDAKGSLESIQREQTKILGMILENQKKAQSAKLAKYTMGGSSMKSNAKLSLGDLGFKPKGTDKVPAMLSPNEFIMNSKATSRNRRVLEKMNQGYSLGGLVKPKYLSTAGSVGDTAAGAGGKIPIGGSIVVERVALDATAEAESERMGGRLAEHVNRGVRRVGNRAIASWLTGMSTAMMGGGADFLQGLFSGSVTDAMDFQRQMRLIAFETKGITGDFRDMQNSFSDLGKVAAETGQSISIMQKVYMSNLKKGFKDNNEGKKVMKSGLLLSTMIGSEAQQTADLFGDWHRNLALSTEDMGELARGMRNVALSTGVTGDELLGAMKSSEGILKNLRNQGNLTSSNAKSIIHMMAASKKAGFEESASKYLGAMSSYSSMMKADNPTKSLLFSVSNRMGGDASHKMQMGTFTKERSNLAGFSKEMKSMIAGFVGKTAEEFDFKKLNDKEKERLAAMLQSYDIEIAEAENIIDVTDEASKGLSGSLEKLKKIGSSKFATKAEKELAKKQESQLYLGASLDYLGAIAKDAKDKGISGALEDSRTSADFNDKRQDFAGMADALTSEMKSAYGIEGTAEQMSQQLAALDPTKAAELNALIIGDQLNKAAKERGVSLDKDYGVEIKNALAKKDEKERTALVRELSEEAQRKASEIAVNEQAATSPEERLALEIIKLNETIRGYTSSFVRGMVDYIGWFGLLAAQIAMLTAMLGYTVAPGLIGFGTSVRSIGPMLRSIGPTLTQSLWRLVGRVSGNPFVSMGGAMGQAARTTLLSGLQRSVVSIMSRAAAPLMIATGALMGVMEAKEAGRTNVEGGILGALTGGARTGSFITGNYGDKAGAGDKALGVAGGAAWGAAVGAAMGMMFPPIAPFAAAFGAIFGGVAEIVKIVTEGTDILQDIFSPFQVIVDYIYNRLVSLWDIVAGIFTLDFGRVFQGIFNLIIGQFLLIPRLIGATIQAVFIGIPKLILRTLSLIWEIPRMLGQALYNGIASLADNEWVGPIFATLRDALGALGSGLMAIWTPISQVFSGLYTVFNDLGHAIFGTAEGGGFFSAVLWVLQNAIWGVSQVIGILLYPLTLLAQALGFILRMVGNLISGIIYPFQYLYDILVGHSIVPDLVMGIIKWFAMLPSKIFNALLSVPAMIGKAFSNVGAYLQSFGTDGIFSTLLSNLGAFYTFVGNTIGNLVNLAKSIFKVLGGILTLDFGMIWEGIKGIGGAIVSQLYNAGDFIYTTIKNSMKFFFNTMKRIPVMLFKGLKAVFFDLPNYLLGMLVDVLWSVGNFFLFTLPKMMWDAFVNSIGALDNFIYDVISWPFRKLGDLIKAVFWDLPIWLGGRIMDGLHAVFVDLPIFLGETIARGLKSIFVDLPMWLGKTILDGISSIFTSMPGAIYGAFHSAASKVGLGWLVEKIAGKTSASTEKGYKTAEVKSKNPAGYDEAMIRMRLKAYGTTPEEMKTSVARRYDDKTAEVKSKNPAGYDEAMIRMRLKAYGTTPEEMKTSVARRYDDKTILAAEETLNATERISMMRSTPVGQHAIPVAQPNDTDVGAVQPVHLRDITDSILRERAGTTGAGKFQSDELSRIEEASFRQVEELEQIKQGITEMVALLKPRGSGVVGGTGESDMANTKDPRRPLHAARFGKMKYGKVAGNANRSIVNNGES